MILNKQTLIVIIGLIALATFGVIIAKFFERNPEESEELSPYVAIPIVLTLYYLYIQNFSFVVYLLSIGAIFILFV